MSDRTRIEARSSRSDPGGFRRLREWLSEIARQEGFGDDATRRLASALNEACANAHRHGYGGRSDGRIDVEVEVGEAWLKVAVRDYGVSFDPAAYIPPSLERLEEGGYGIHLMRALVDRLEFDSTMVGTRVVLTKTRPEGGCRG